MGRKSEDMKGLALGTMALPLAAALALSAACTPVALDPNRSPVTVAYNGTPVDRDSAYRIEQVLRKGDGIAVNLYNNTGNSRSDDNSLPQGSALTIESQSSREPVTLTVRDKWLDPYAGDAMVQKANTDNPPAKDRTKTIIELVGEIHDWQDAHPRPAQASPPPAPVAPKPVPVPQVPRQPSPPTNWAHVGEVLGGVALYLMMFAAVGSATERRLQNGKGDWGSGMGYMFAILWWLVIPVLFGDFISNWPHRAMQRRETKKTNAEVAKINAQTALRAEENRAAQIALEQTRANIDYLKQEGVRGIEVSSDQP